MVSNGFPLIWLIRLAYPNIIIRIGYNLFHTVWCGWIHKPFWGGFVPENKITRADSRNEIELPKTVGILYSDVRREYFPTESLYITEKDADQDARLVGEYLEPLGISVLLYPGNADLPVWLSRTKPEMVINLVDSINGYESLSSAIPGVLEILGIPYTGADILGMSLDTNKFLIMKLLQQNGVPVPNYQLFNTPRDYLDPSLRFPLISKLNAIHGSVEITEDAVSENEKHLRDRIRRLIRTYDQPVLVEEFISGREITAILLHGKIKKVYLAEKIFSHTVGKYVLSHVRRPVAFKVAAVRSTTPDIMIRF